MTTRWIFLSCFVFCTAQLFATITVQNQFIRADMLETSGQFSITSNVNRSELTYGDGTTSFVNFKFHRQNTLNDTIFSNATIDVLAPHCGHIFADSVKLRGDTAVAYYNELGYQMQIRLYPIITESGTSGTIIIDFYSFKTDPATSSILNGLVWMNDVAVVGDPGTGCGTSGDHPVCITSEDFPARPKLPGALCWQGMMNGYIAGGLPDIPDYFHVAQGFPNYTCSECGFAYGKLKGPGLTPPDEFYIGDWGTTDSGFKSIDWSVNQPHIYSGGADYIDAAVIYKWIVHGSQHIRTQYGLDDSVNDLKICPGILFKEVYFPLVIARDSATGFYNPSPAVINGFPNPSPAVIKFWVINVDRTGFSATATSTTCDLTKTKHLVFDDGSKLRTVTLGSGTLGDRAGAKDTFAIYVDSTTFLQKGIVDEEPISLHVNLSNAALIGDDGAVCPFTIKVIGEGLPPRDTLAPIVKNSAQSRYQSSWTAVDNRIHDKGIDSVFTTRNVNNNYLLTVQPPNFTPCDTSTFITITAKVVDTSQPACIDFHVKDCANNDSLVTLCYTPRVDSLAPTITAVDSTGKYAGAAACNTRCFTFTAADNRPTDYGMQSVATTSLINFSPIVINNGKPVNAHDPTATYQLCVIDSLHNAHADVVLKDFVGNTTKQSVDYCSVVDDNAPAVLIVHDPVKKLVTVRVFETSPWDRGLSSVALDPSSANVVTTPSPIIFSRDSAVFTIEPIDTLQPSSFDICAKDSFFTANASDKANYFSADPTHHQTCVTGTFSGDDTLPPNVIITPLTSTTARVEINDIHIVGGVKYPLDLGVQTIVIDSHNVVIDSAFTNTGCDSVVRFRIKVRDTLAFCDTAAYVNVSAIDCRFNQSKTVRWSVPIHPDTLPPVISASVDATGKITIHVTDNRKYDRGLGSVVLSNVVNLTPFSSAANDGRSSDSLVLGIINNQLDASATLTVTDRWGASCSLPPKGTHTETFPISFGVVSLAPNQFELVENAIGNIALSRTGSFNASAIDTVDFDVHYDSTALDFQFGNSGITTFTRINPSETGTVHVQMISAGGITDATQLPALPFKALYIKPGTDSQTVAITISNVVVNNGNLKKVLSADNNSFILEPPGIVTIPPGQITVQKTCDRTGSSSVFSVTQNFPNPFWEHAQVQYNLPGNGHVRMTIYNVFGEEIKTVVDADQSQGVHTVQVASDGLAPGTYFYKVRAECSTCVQEFVAVKRMVVAR